MSKRLSAKERVLKKYPSAFSQYVRERGTTIFTWVIYSSVMVYRLLGEGSTPRAAWAAAARNMKEKR